MILALWNLLFVNLESALTMSDDIDSRHFNPDDYQVSARMGGLNKPKELIVKSCDRLRNSQAKVYSEQEMKQAKIELLDETRSVINQANIDYDFDYCSGVAIEKHIADIINKLKSRIE